MTPYRCSGRERALTRVEVCRYRVQTAVVGTIYLVGGAGRVYCYCVQLCISQPQGSTATQRTGARGLELSPLRHHHNTPGFPTCSSKGRGAGPSRGPVLSIRLFEIYASTYLSI